MAKSTLNLRELPIDKKPITHLCFHYYDDTREYPYVGAVWQSDDGGKWSAFCTSNIETYGHLGYFDDKQSALECLKGRVAGNLTAVGNARTLDV